MAPFYGNGSLTTDKRTINDEDGWDTQSEWEAFQSATQVEIVDGAIELGSIPASAIAHYPFEDNTDTATAEDVWNGNDASLFNSPTYDSDAAEGEYALSLNGSDQYGEMPIIVGDTGPPISIRAWVRLDSTPGDFRSIAATDDGSNGYNFGVTDGGSWDFTWRGGAQIRTGSFSTGQYYHMVATIGSGSAEMYRGDVEIGSDTYSSVNNPVDNTRIGDTAGFGNYWPGDIDGLKVYSKKLTPTEVSNLYNTGTI